ncbi:MAG: porin [Deltaproteobacteria bacterium]
MEKKTARNKNYGKVLAIALAGAVAIPTVLPSNAKALKWEKEVGGKTLTLKPYAFSQITCEALSGQGQDSVKFGADRVRIGYKLSWGQVFTHLQLDFNRPDISQKTAGLPEIIKDVVFGYKFDKALKFSVGMFKTPVGYDFLLPGKTLDITKRGMEKSLVLERALGAKLSGSDIGGTGLGYDVGIFNPTTRSSAVSGGTAGDQQGYAARLYYDMNKTLHAEVSYGGSTEAGGVGTEDYTVWDAAVVYRWDKLTLKAEYIDGSNIRGVDGRDEYVWYAHAGYRFLPMFEAVVRHYQGEEDPSNTSLGNTFLGLNIFLKPDDPQFARIQLNYVFASGDKEDWGGIGGYKDNAFLSQFQISF